ncbi:MAG TPA: radical SAM protein [Gammaproteobacteria bacterium]
MVELSQRGDIRLGYRCNARCGFCYYQDKLDTPVELEPTTEQLANRLRVLRAHGATEVEFTGGEPTIRSDLTDLIRLARSLGFVNVSIITNGLRLAKRAYAEEIVAAGANDVLFSIHGHDASLHDAHTALPGSFARILQAVANVRELGGRVRATTTVTGRNHAHLGEILALLVGLNVACIHLAVFSPVAQANATDERLHVRYSDAAASIKNAIDRHREQLPPLSVKYIPFCFMRGYESYVMNLYQQSFDPDDWNYYLSNKVRRSDSWVARVAIDVASAMGGLLAKNYVVPVRHGWSGWKVFGLTRIVELLRKRRPAACRSCAYDIVCDHVWKDYIARFGDAEIQAVPGRKIVDPAWCYGLARYRTPGAPVAAPKRA